MKAQKDKEPRIKCAIDYIEVNGERFTYANQMMRGNYLCLITKDQSIQPECPSYVKRTSQINQLDRKYFFQTFVKEIIKSLEKMDPQNCITIIRKVPKSIRYMNAVLKIISIQKLSKLLQDNSFFLELYVSLEETVSKKNNVNLSFVQKNLDLIKLSYQRLFFLLDHLVLENQTFRNTLVNCTKEIVMEQMAKDDFHQNQIFKKKSQKNKQFQVEEQNDQNDSKQLNSSTDTLSEHSKFSKSLICLQSFVTNSLGILKSLQKLKFNPEQINQFLFQDKFSDKIKSNFEQLCQNQQFLQLLELFSIYNSIDLWQKIFGKQKNLDNFQKLINKSLTNLTLSVKQQAQSLTQSKQNIEKSKKQWRRCIHILQQLLKMYNKQANKFVQKVILSIIQSEIFIQNIPFISIFLDIKFKDTEPFRNQLNVDSIFLSSLGQKLDQVLLQQKKIKQNQRSVQINITKHKTKFCKRILILMIQFYRTLIENQQKFELKISPEPIKYLLFLCKSQKGALFGCRQSFIKFLKNKVKSYQNEQRMKNNLCKNEELQKENLVQVEEEIDHAILSKYKVILESCENQLEKQIKKLANAE